MYADWYVTMNTAILDLGFVAFEESYNLIPVRVNVLLKDVWSGKTITIDNFNLKKK
jgi:hypothetical protein